MACPALRIDVSGCRVSRGVLNSNTTIINLPALCGDYGIEFYEGSFVQQWISKAADDDKGQRVLLFKKSVLSNGRRLHLDIAGNRMP